MELVPLAREATGIGYSLDDLIERYGEDNGRFLYEEFTRYQQSYTQLTFIETGIEPGDGFEVKARAKAAEHDWQFVKVGGHLELFRRLLAGEWDERDFLIVPPGYKLSACYDDRIMAAEKLVP